MRKVRPAVAVLGALLLGGCASAPVHNPFIGGPAAVSAMRTIALASTDLPKDVSDRSSLQQRFDSAFVTELKAAGFVVIPPAQVEPIWRSLADSAKVYDSNTGKLDPDKQAALMGAMSREMKTRFGADAWVLPDFTVRSARYGGGWCSWDGTKQYVQTKGELLKNAFFGISKSGVVPALSVRVVISDSTGRELYRGYGGVAALVKMTAGGSEDVAREKAFADATRNMGAVRLALEPLVKSRQ